MSGVVAVAEGIPAVSEQDKRAGTPSERSSRVEAAWSPWATLFLGIALYLAYQFATIAVLSGIVIDRLAATGWEVTGSEMVQAVSNDGRYGFLATGIAATFCVGLILGITKMRSSTHRAYLGIVMPDPRDTAGWVAGMVALQAFWMLAPAFGLGSEHSEYVVEIARSGAGEPLMWIAYVLLIPAFEELYARGFLYAGWSRSRLGAWGAVLATTLFWTAIHPQYTGVEIMQVASAGLLLGMARLHTGSIFPCLIMHACVNYVALDQASRFALAVG